MSVGFHDFAGHIFVLFIAEFLMHFKEHGRHSRSVEGGDELFLFLIRSGGRVPGRIVDGACRLFLK